MLEREVEGEKMVTRHILEQTRRSGDDLGAIKMRFTRVEADVGQLKTDMGSVKVDLRGLRSKLPGIVGDAVGEALAERQGEMIETWGQRVRPRLPA
jgi:hypothetical protein